MMCYYLNVQFQGQRVKHGHTHTHTHTHKSFGLFHKAFGNSEIIAWSDTIQECLKRAIFTFTVSTPCRHGGGVEVWLHSFLTPALDGVQWLIHPCPLYPRGNIWHPLKRWLDELWNRSGCFGEKSRLPGFEPRHMTENMKIILKQVLVV
jgi:hypothetical protein